MAEANLWDRIVRCFRLYAAPLRFSLRFALAASLAYAVAGLLNFPLHGLWAVLTAVMVTQMSVGASVRATAEYVVGTFGGVVYASALALLIPHHSPIALGGLLALTMAPLAFASALSPRFRVAPFTGALVLLIAGEFGEGPVETAMLRVVEVILGGAIAVTVSLLVLPERAHELEREVAARLLDQLGHLLPRLLAGFTQQLDVEESRRLQNEIGQTVAGLQAHAASSKSERLLSLVQRPEPDPDMLMGNLLRLRHDLVIIGRAALAPLPAAVAVRLGPFIDQVAASAGNYLDESATALALRRSAPSLAPYQSALEAYTAEMIALRSEGVMQSLSIGDVERTFALSFALEQMERSFSDLAHTVEAFSRRKR
jgi:uncharacterized membrane protein YccC